MTLLRAIAASIALTPLACWMSIDTAAAAGPAPVTLSLQRVGTTSLPAASVGTDSTTRGDEIDTAVMGGDADSAVGEPGQGGVNRTLPGTVTGKGRPISPRAKPKSQPVLDLSIEGVNLFNQRFANGGNQFTVEPPDQALCVGNGFVVESVNDVLRVYRTDGTPATGVIDLNTFYRYPPAVVRSGPKAGQRGPSITDPVCLFDRVIGRFVHVVLTLDRISLTNSRLNGNNHLDIAVSDTADPTGTWTIYKLPAQNNGTEGTPNHHCDRGFCLGDYPHIGADANAIYLTTNEFATLGGGFYGAQVYGIGHNLLTGSVGSIVLFDTLGTGPDGAGFTVWPAQSPGAQFDVDNGGTEYFLSSNAVFADDGTSKSILLWAMTNTASLNTATPAVSLGLVPIAVDMYAVPPLAKQKAGSQPLSQCIADLTVYNFPPTGTCGAVIAGTGTNHDNTTWGGLDANDSRMQQVAYANGNVWGALDTAVNVGGEERAGIAYYVINPNAVKVVLQGQAGVPGTDLTYPAVGVTESGRGVIAFTLTGDNDYPSAAFAGFDAKIGMGDIQIAAAGAGPWDGFTNYKVLATRPRWGDYGAAAIDGESVWISSEYVAQTCSYATFLGDRTCGGTRAPLGNWATRISKVTP